MFFTIYLCLIVCYSFVLIVYFSCIIIVMCECVKHL
jgi:hypothetical protein